MEQRMNSMRMSEYIALFLPSASINTFSRRHVRKREIYDEVTRIDHELQQDGHIVDVNSVPSGSVHSGKKTNLHHR